MYKIVRSAYQNNDNEFYIKCYFQYYIKFDNYVFQRNLIIIKSNEYIFDDDQRIKINLHT